MTVAGHQEHKSIHLDHYLGELGFGGEKYPAYPLLCPKASTVDSLKEEKLRRDSVIF